MEASVVDYRYDPADVAFREQLRSRIHDEMPTNFPGAFVEEPEYFELAQEFCRRLAEDNELTIAWPAEYGGQAASLWTQSVLREEMWSHHEPRGAQYMGLNWIGPALMMFGTPEQKQKHLPPIAAGDVVWCQGFSEPESGSDLASLRLRTDRVEGGWRVNGQKIWTSYATMAQWCFLAARTDPSGPKHHGITIFLVPMDRPGIEVRPLQALVGPHHLNEVFFEDVFVAESDVLGAVDEGWSVITAALTHERVGIARYARALGILSAARASLGEARWNETTPQTKASYARAIVHGLVAQLLSYRVVDMAAREQPLNVEASIARIAVTAFDQEAADVALDVLGPISLFDYHDPDIPLHGHAEGHWRYHQASTVASGTIEVMKSIVAKATM
jgi:alkylation response protein AidB-like acyl-CoA dehydrogenase